MNFQITSILTGISYNGSCEDSTLLAFGDSFILTLKRVTFDEGFTVKDNKDFIFSFLSEEYTFPRCYNTYIHIYGEELDLVFVLSAAENKE